MSEIFHRCVGLDRNFTSDEYARWLEEHPEGASCIVYEYEGFEYNFWDVCLNAREALKWQDDGHYNFRIRVAKAADGWLVGIDYSHGNGGYGHGPSLKSKKRYASEREAVFTALDYMRQAIEKQIAEAEQRRPALIMNNEDRDAAKAPAKLNNMLRVVTDYMQQFDPRQLTLF